MHAGNTLGSSTNTQRFVTNFLQATVCMTPANTTVKWTETQLNWLFLLLFRPPCKPFFNNVVKSLLGLNRRASTANPREAGGLSSREQRAESSSSCFSNGLVYNRLTHRRKVKATTLCSTRHILFHFLLNLRSCIFVLPVIILCQLMDALFSEVLFNIFSTRWRPKRASDRLLPPDLTSERESPPQKKKSGEISGKISVNVSKCNFIRVYKDLVWCSDILIPAGCF